MEKRGKFFCGERGKSSRHDFDDGWEAALIISDDNSLGLRWEARNSTETGLAVNYMVQQATKHITSKMFKLKILTP